MGELRKRGSVAQDSDADQRREGDALLHYKAEPRRSLVRRFVDHLFLFVVVHYLFWFWPMVAVPATLYYYGHWWLALAVVAWYLTTFFDMSHVRGGRPWDAFRRHRAWRAAHKYLGLEMIRTRTLDPSRQVRRSRTDASRPRAAASLTSTAAASLRGRSTYSATIPTESLFCRGSRATVRLPPAPRPAHFTPAAPHTRPLRRRQVRGVLPRHHAACAGRHAHVLDAGLPRAFAVDERCGRVPRIRRALHSPGPLPHRLPRRVRRSWPGPGVLRTHAHAHAHGSPHTPHGHQVQGDLHHRRHLQGQQAGPQVPQGIHQAGHALRVRPRPW